MKGKATSASDDKEKRDGGKESDVADGVGEYEWVPRRQSEIGIRKGKGEKVVTWYAALTLRNR